MSVSIDEKVVEMRFNNRQFEQGIQTTIKSIDNLNKATEFTSSQKNIKNLQQSFDKFDTKTMSSAFESLNHRMSALGVAGAEVIRRITDSAIDMGRRIESVIMKPISMAKSGGIARALNIEQAQFQLEGLGVAWEKISDDIDYGVKDTAYGLDAAAKVASQLVASNVKLGSEMKNTLRGISGVAAMTGSTYEDIGNIFTTVAGNGKLMTIQLHQLAARGLNIAAELAKQLGKSEAEIRQMVTDGQINFKMFATAMDNAFGQHAKDANKTFTGSMSNIRAALSRTGAAFATPFHKSVIAPLNSLKELVNSMNSVLAKPAERLGNFMNDLGKAADKIMKSKSVINTVKNLTAGVTNTFKFLGSILNNIGAAFFTVFPPKTVHAIAEMAKNFKEMSKGLSLTEEQMTKIQNVARGVFSIFSIIGNVIGFLIDVIRDITRSKAGDVIGKAIQAIANGLQTINYFVKVVRAAYNYCSKAFGGIGGVLKNFGTFTGMIFATLEDKFESVKKVLQIFRGEVDQFSSEATKSLSTIIGKFKEFGSAVWDKLGAAGTVIKNVFDSLGEAISKTDKKIEGVTKRSGVLVTILRGLAIVAKVIVAVFSTVLSTVANLLREMDWGKIIEQGLSLMIITKFESVISKITGFIKGLREGFTNTTTTVDAMKSTLGSVSGAFNEFQKSMQTGRLLMIAGTIGILALSLLQLSKIGSLKELGIAIAALGSLSSILVLLGHAFNNLGDGKFIKKGALQIVLMAAALKILSGALIDLSVLNFEQLSNGAIALAATMAILAGAFNMMASTSEKGKFFTKSSQKWVKGATQLVIMAAAVKILAGVVVQLGHLNYEELGKGLVGMAISLGALSKVAVDFNNIKINAGTAFSVVELAASIVIVSKAVQMLGSMDIWSLVKGLAAFAGVLTALSVVSMQMGILQTNISPRTGMAIMMMSGAVVIMAKAVEKLGALDIQNLITGLIGMTASMTVIAGMAQVLSKHTINQNAGIAIDLIAIAIASIADSVKKLGSLDVDTLQKGLIASAVALAGLAAMMVVMDQLTKESSEMLKGAASLVIMATALGMVTSAVAAVSILSNDELARGLAATIGPLIALATAAIAMKGAVKGAAAMVIVAAAMDLMAPAIILMGSAPIDAVSQSLQVLGVVVGASALQMLVLGVAAKILKKSAMTIASLSVSMLTGAAAFAVFAGGALLLVKAIQMVISMISSFGSAGSGLFEGFANLGKGISGLITGFFEGLEESSSKIFPAIGNFIIGAFEFIKNFISKRIPMLIEWLLDTVVSFINGIADAIDEYLPKILEAIGRVGTAVFKALKKMFSNFDGLSEGAMLKIVGVIALIVIAFRSLSNSVKQIKATNIAGALVLVGGVVAIAFALVQLSSIPWGNLLVAVTAMSAGMLSLSLMLQSVSKTNFDVKSIIALGIGVAALLILGRTIQSLVAYDWKQILSAGTAISMVLVAYGGIFTLIASNKAISSSSLASIGIFALGTLALLPIAMSLKELAKSDWKSMAASAVALTATFLGYAAVFTVMSMIPISGALSAIGNLAIALGGLALILALLGAIKQIPGVEWLVNEGSSFANLLGEAIGGFVGSIIAGFGKALSSILPQIGSDLAGFWTNAQPFFDGVSAVGPDTMNAVQSLAGALLSLTATELIQGIANFFGADIDFKDLGQQLSDFSEGMVDFADKTAGLDAKSVEKAANAAKMLGEFASSVPLKGGLLSDLMGDRDLAGFADALPKLGEGLSDFAKETEDLDTKAIEKAASAAQMLVELNKDVPLQGGLLGDLMGNRRLDEFGDQLPTLGEGLSDFAEETAGLDATSAANATMAAQMLANLNQNIPLQGGLLGELMGNRRLDEFGEQLPELGSGLKEFATNVTGIDTNAATNAATVARMLGALSADLPNTGGIASWFTGDSSLSDFGEQLPDFGTHIKTFADNIKGMDQSSVSTASGLINVVINMLKYANNEGISASYVGEFSTNLKTFGESYKKFATDVNTNNDWKKFADGMTSIIKVLKKINKVDTSKVKEFTDNLKGLTDAGIKDVTTAADNTVAGAIEALKKNGAEFKTVGEEFVNKIVQAIVANSYKVKDEMVKTVKSAATASRSEYLINQFKMSGKNMVDGFAVGMQDNEKMQKVVEAAKKMANKAKDTVNKELDIHSPSKVMQKLGGFTVEGFTDGIGGGLGSITKTAKDLIGNFTDTVGSSITNTAGTGKSNLSIDGFLGMIGLGGKSKDKSKKKAEKAGEDTGKSVAKGLGNKNVQKEAKKSGSSIGKSTASGIKFSSKDLKKALASYRTIMGEYVKQTEKFSSKMLKTDISKKGFGQLKTTSKYILSGIDNKYLRTAASNLGTDLAKVINSAMRAELKKKDTSAAVLEKLDEAGHKLVDARKRKKQAQNTIDSSKSSRKEIAAARKDLSKANKDITKYQKQVEKYEKQLKKAGASVAKSLTQQAIGELYSKMDEFKKVFNSMDSSGSIGNTLVKIPSVLNAYIANVKSSASYAKGVVSVVEKTFSSNIKIMDKATNKQIKTYEQKLKEAKKKEKDAKKILNNDSSTKKQQKKAKKDMEAAGKTIINLNKKIAKERAKLGGAGVVDKFAQRLYFNSEAYAEEVKNVKTSTKKIKKIQKDARIAKKKLDKATKAEDKKKYADQLNDLKKQYKAEEKLLKKSATNIAKGPKKALNAYKQTLKDTYKQMLNIASLDISPKIQLEGFDKFEKTSNLVAEASVNSDIFGKAVANAGSKFSIFGDISAKTTESFNFFNDSISTGINLLERFTKVGSVEKQALFENADSQLEAYEEFYKGIEELRGRGLSDTIVDDLKSQGPQALNYIRGFLSMTDDELASYNTRVSKMNAFGAANYANEIKDSMKKAQRFTTGLQELATLGVRQEIIDEFKSMGQESAQGYVDSLLANGRDGINELNSLYDEYSKASSRSMLKAAQEQYEASLTYSKIIDDLKKTALDPAIIKEIEAMGAEEAVAYGRSILNNLGDIPSLNELYWKSQSNDKTMREQMAEANAEAETFMAGLQELSDMGVNKDFVDYVKGLGIDEGMSVLQRAKREFGSIADGIKKEEIELFNAEYAKSKHPMEVLLGNLDSQIKGYDEYTANLDTVLQKLGGDSKSEYFKYLKEMGMDGAEYVEALAQATEDQIQRYREMIDQREARNRRERAQSLIDSWNAELDTIKNYTSNVALLISRGASQTLVDDLASMDVKEAASKVEALLAMDQNSFSQWNAQYTQMMNQDVSKLVNQMVGVYAAAGNITVDQAKKIATDSAVASKEITVKGVYDTAKAHKEATLATYPEVKQTSSDLGVQAADAFSTALSTNIGAVPVSAIVKAFNAGLQKKSIAKKLVTAGEAICNGVVTGINNKKVVVTTEAFATANAAYTQFKNYLNKTKGQTLAKNLCNGIHTIMTSQQPILVLDAYNIAKPMNDQFATYLNYDQGYYYGSMMGQGVANGLDSMASACEAAAARIIAAANAAAAARARIGSPSKLWAQYGQWMGEGLAIGLNNSTDQVESAADGVVSGANSALQNTLSEIRNGINTKLDFNPTITPVLDLSRVTAQARSINAMMENSTIGATVRTINTSNNGEENQNGNVTYNFEQNNYSPKALSNLELYRQTRNQFAMAKEALGK